MKKHAFLLMHKVAVCGIERRVNETERASSEQNDLSRNDDGIGHSIGHSS